MNKPNPAKKERRAAQIIAAIKESRGLLTLAAEKVGITYRTINNYTHEFPSVQQAVEEAAETQLDIAEDHLYNKIKDKDAEGDLTAIIFFLKTKGKGRGYIERNEVTGAEGGPVQVENVRNKLIARINRLSAGNEENKSDSEPKQ